MVHPGEFGFHVIGGKHVDVGDVHGLEDVFLKVVIERESC